MDLEHATALPMQSLASTELVLEPLEARHAEAMYEVLSDASLYRYLDRAPPTSAGSLRDEYLRLERRISPDGRQAWLNWIVCAAGSHPIGFVQATIEASTAWIAYVFARDFCGRGHATNACRLVIEHLAARYGVERYRAVVEAENIGSIRLLERLHFHLADETNGVTLSPSERLFTRETP